MTSALEDAVLLALVQDWLRTTGTTEVQVWIDAADERPSVSVSAMPAALKGDLKAWCLARVDRTYELEPPLGPDWKADGDDPMVMTTWHFRLNSPPLCASTIRVEHTPQPYTGP
jgi:hypothetical protein